MYTNSTELQQAGEGRWVEVQLAEGLLTASEPAGGNKDCGGREKGLGEAVQCVMH